MIGSYEKHLLLTLLKVFCWVKALYKKLQYFNTKHYYVFGNWLLSFLHKVFAYYVRMSSMVFSPMYLKMNQKLLNLIWFILKVHSEVIYILYFNLLEFTCKILVGKVWWVIVRNELEHFFLYSVWTLPVTPNPFRYKSGHTEDTKMDEDSNFGIIIPLKINKLLFFAILSKSL